MFKTQLPTIEKTDFMVTFEAIATSENPIIITQSEYMRRMKDMAAMQPMMSFYADMPDSYNMVLNTEHPLIKKVLANAENTLDAQVKTLDNELAEVNIAIKAINDKPAADRSEDEKKTLSEQEAKAANIRSQQSSTIAAYAKEDSTVKQLIDIALLGNNMLKGEALNNFLKRSIQLL